MKTLIETRLKALVAILFSGLTAATFATAADLYVPAGYPTIQAAVNAAKTNDTIHIASGVYTGQVEIVSKTLTLIGQPGSILRATRNMTSFAGSSNSPIMEIRSSQVTVRGLTFEGERLAERFVGPGDLLGIYIRSSSGNVENCAFYGFRESAPGPENAFAITAAAIHDGEVNVRVAGCTFADNYGAIYCWGLSDRKYINLTIENNIIVGPGPLTGDISCTGIYIGEGVGGRIAGNTISGFSYVGTTADFPISFGILGVNTANYPPSFGVLLPLIIEGNSLRDNQWHIALVKGDNSVVRNNRFQGTAPGFIPVGLALSGTNVTIANNQFEDMPEGIRLFGNDPDYGTLLGIAVNAQVTSNRFCGVTTPITVQPLASATQTGTLTNSCSSPPLTIAPAVLLSWPGEENGWTVESATSVDGPWTPSDATPFTEYGRHSIAVPTDSAHRFFRLR
jgi:nitrous oxidase accessory protein NosD